MSQTPAGWYPDANGTIRWWDGTQWTEHTQPPPAPPSPPAPAYDAPTEPPPLEDDRTVIRRSLDHADEAADASGASAQPADQPGDTPGDLPTEQLEERGAEPTAPMPSDAPQQPDNPWGAAQTPQPPPAPPWATPADPQAQQPAAPGYPAQPGYPGQPEFPAQPGQPDYPAQPGYPGQPAYSAPPNYSPPDYAGAPSYQQGYPGAYQQWQGSTPPKRTVKPWMIIVAGAVAVVIVVGLVLFFVLRGGGSDTSAQDFCGALDGLPSNASLSEAISAVQAKGLPSDIPADAKQGFALYVQYATQLDQAGSVSDAQLATIVGGAANVDDMKAFNTYVASTCGQPAPQPSAG